MIEQLVSREKGLLWAPREKGGDGVLKRSIAVGAGYD